MHILALLLNTKVDTADKIKRILKTAVEATLKTWRGQKWLQKDVKVPECHVVSEPNDPFFLKSNWLLPESKQVNKTKNGNVIKTIWVRRKSKYFSGRSARMFWFVKFYHKWNIYFLFTTEFLLLSLRLP